MTIWIMRKGNLVMKRNQRHKVAASTFPSPRVSRMESFESPVTEKTVSSWRERDRDMHAAGAVDPRDIPQKAFEKRREAVKRLQDAEPAKHI